MSKEFKKAELSQEQLDFIKSYMPEDRGFTSEKEMANIIAKFQLNSISNIEDMRAVRNAVVDFCTDLIEEDWHKVETMQSITAVIDHCMYQINPLSI